MTTTIKKSPSAKMIASAGIDKKKTTTEGAGQAQAEKPKATVAKMEPKAAAATTEKKAPAKTTAKAKKPEMDMLVKTAHEVENMTEAKAMKEAHDLIEISSFNYFKIGGILQLIQNNDWWEKKGYETFAAFIEAEMNLHYRKALHLIGIYDTLTKSEVLWEECKDIGWTKLKELRGIMTKENKEQWLQAARENTTIQLADMVKEAKKAAKTAEGGEGGEGGESPETPEGGKATTLTLKVKPDQKEVITTALDQMKEESHTDYDSVAMERICMAYLEGGTGKSTAPQKSLKELMEGELAEHEDEPQDAMQIILDTFAEVFPGVDLTIEVPSGDDEGDELEAQEA